MNPADIGWQKPIWKAAYRTYRHRWVRLAARWVGEAKAEGLVQELLTTWWEGSRTFATPPDLDRLMRRAIPNRALDWLVGRKRQVTAPPEELPAAAQPCASTSSSPDARALVEQLIEAVWPVALATLASGSHAQAQAFVLRVGRRLPPRKIAELQHTTANTVGVRIVRVARRLSNRVACAFPDGLDALDDELRREVFCEISVRLASLDRYRK